MKKPEFDIVPTGSRIVVRRKDFQKETKSIIIRPDTVENVAIVADVIACGPDCVRVNIGDTILMARYSGMDVGFFNDQVGDQWKDCVLFNEVDVVAIVKPKKEK